MAVKRPPNVYLVLRDRNGGGGVVPPVPPSNDNEAVWFMVL